MSRKIISSIMILVLFSSLLPAFASGSVQEDSTVYTYSLDEDFSGDYGYTSNTYKSLLIGGSISQYLNYREIYRSTSGYSYSIQSDDVAGAYFEAVGNNTSMSWSGMFMEVPGEVPVTEYQIAEANIKLSADSQGSTSSVFLQITDKEQEKKNANSGYAKKIAILGVYPTYIKITTSSTDSAIIPYSTYGIKSFQADEWHNIKLLLDTTRNVYDLIIDGVLIATDLPTARTVTNPSIGRVFFNPFSSNTANKAGIDNVKIYGITADQANNVSANAYSETINRTYDLTNNGQTGRIILPILGDAVNADIKSKISVSGTVAYSISSSTASNNAYSQLSISDAAAIAENDNISISISRPDKETGIDAVKTISFGLYDKKFSLNEDFIGEFGYTSNTYSSLLLGGSISQYLNYRDTYRTTAGYSYSIQSDDAAGTYFEAVGNNTSMSWSGMFMEVPGETPSTEYQIAEANIKLSADSQGLTSSAFLQITDKAQEKKDANSGYAQKIAILGIYKNYIKVMTSSSTSISVAYSTYGIKSFEKDEWHNIKLILDTTRSVYDLIIDDILVATDLPTARDVTDPSIGRIFFNPFSSNTASRAGIDNVKIYGVAPSQANAVAANAYRETINRTYTLTNNAYTGRIIIPIIGNIVNESITSKISFGGDVDYSISSSTVGSNAYSQLSITDATAITESDNISISISRPDKGTGTDATKTINFGLYDKKLLPQETALYEDFSGTFTTDSNNLVYGNSLQSYESRAKNFGTFSIDSDSTHTNYLSSNLTAETTYIDRGARIKVATPLSYDYQVVDMDFKLETANSAIFLQFLVDNDGSDELDNAAKTGIIEIHDSFMKMHFGNAQNTTIQTENIYYSDYNLSAIKTNEWKKIRIVFDKKNALYDVYLEDILIATDTESLKNLTSYTYNGIKYICFNSIGSAGTKTAIDSIKVYGVTPELANIYTKNSFDRLIGNFDIQSVRSQVLPYCGGLGVRNSVDKAKISYTFSDSSGVDLQQNYYNTIINASGAKSYLAFIENFVDTTLTVNITRSYTGKAGTTLSVDYRLYKAGNEGPTYNVQKLYFKNNKGVSSDLPSSSGKIVGADIDLTSVDVDGKDLIIAVYKTDALFDKDCLFTTAKLSNLYSGKNHYDLDISLPTDISNTKIAAFFFEDLDRVLPAAPKQNYEVEPTDLFEIVGEYKVASSMSDQELQYTVSNPSYTVKWSVQGEGVDIDPDTGKLQISENTGKNTNAVIKASLADNPFVYATKKITVVTPTTYQNDNLRMETTKAYVDKVLSTSDAAYPTTPLIPNGFDVTTDRAAEWTFKIDANHPNSKVPFSDLASQGNFMRSLEAMAALTNDQKYRERMLDIYSAYTNDYRAVNGLLNIGGHAIIDLNTKKYVGADGNIYTHELKSQLMYNTPLFEANSDVAATYMRQIWLRHIKDFSNLSFNRHADLTGFEETPLDAWNNIDNYNESNLEMICGRDVVTFRSSANDYIHAAVDLYKNTGDEKGLIWAKRLLDRYNALKNSTTDIGVYQISTNHNAPGVLAPPDNWWELDNYSDYTATYYGDRAYNQFADDLIRDGVFPETKRDYILEANYIEPVSLYVNGAMVEIELAKAFGYDSENGKNIMKSLIKSMAGFVKYAYVPSTNRFNRIWNDGTVMTGYKIKRNGYYGKAGQVIGYDKVTGDCLASFCKAYFESDGIEGLAHEREEMWRFIRNAFNKFGIGDVGISSPQDKAMLNINNTCNDPYILLALLEIYNNTSSIEYLDAARKIGDNIIQNNVYNGWFVKDTETTKYKYTRLDDMYCYALVKLEAATIDQIDVVPETLFGSGYFHSYCIYYRDGTYKRLFCEDAVWKETR